MDEQRVTARSSAALWLTAAIVALHAIPLAASIRDYRVSVDSGYHVSLARWYAEHHSAWWDSINFQPRGRPNLQGPALHVAIAALGRALGGTGDSYVLANAILALVQWLCAVFTVWYFAPREGGDDAGLIAVALLTGSAFVAGSFYVGLPSGWIFIVVPWAIYAFQFLRYRDWYRGAHGHVATQVAPLLVILGAAALVRIAREPRQNAFFIA